MKRLPALAAALFCLCPLFAQEPTAQAAAAKTTIVVRSHSPVHRHIGATHTRYVVPTAPSTATAKQAPLPRRVPSLRFLQLRR